MDFARPRVRAADTLDIAKAGRGPFSSRNVRQYESPIWTVALDFLDNGGPAAASREKPARKGQGALSRCPGRGTRAE
jgi:hypothetical protein